jgi:hypothetical protein
MTATTKRKTAARKPAKRAPTKTAVAPVNGNGTANGHAEPALAPPEEFIPREPLEVGPELPDHPYGERMIQVFTPSEGAPIVVPHISTVPVTEEFLWDNHKRKLDLMHQSWAWMNLAQIPDDIQRQVVKLEGGDKKRFWQEWFSGFVPPPSGEPPGES